MNTPLVGSAGWGLLNAVEHAAPAPAQRTLNIFGRICASCSRVHVIAVVILITVGVGLLIAGYVWKKKISPSNQNGVTPEVNLFLKQLGIDLKSVKKIKISRDQLFFPVSLASPITVIQREKKHPCIAFKIEAKNVWELTRVAYETRDSISQLENEKGIQIPKYEEESLLASEDSSHTANTPVNYAMFGKDRLCYRQVEVKGSRLFELLIFSPQPEVASAIFLYSSESNGQTTWDLRTGLSCCGANRASLTSLITDGHFMDLNGIDWVLPSENPLQADL